MLIGRRALVVMAAATVACVALGVTPAVALDLDTAKARGWIGERRDGYIGLVDAAAPAEAAALVQRINAERRVAYDGVAAQNSVPRDQVEALAGQKLIERAAQGTFVMDAAGRWSRK